MIRHRWYVPQNPLVTRSAARDFASLNLRFAIVIALFFIIVGCSHSPPSMLIIIETPQKININTASKAQLMTLPSIGSVKAQRIIEGRPYQRVADLFGIKVICEKTMVNIEDKITVN